MKHHLIISIIILSISCTNKNTARKTMDNNTAVMVGNDADAHGCKASAGYTWSVIKNTCIRLWEVGVQLSPIDNKEPYTSITTAIINDDKTKVELFIVGETSSILLDKNTEQVFSGSGYSMIQENNKWLLKKDNRAIYKE
ncbi:hypothetical protein [Emticicia sp. SJ17W-69]|uniref:hypothetical protein n=1 Tax=Emticicia sp. SJ17W-69 TaxID=3421657 RepID=UPI003EB87C55